MKKVIIKGRWNDPIECEWKGNLITTLRAIYEQTLEDDNTGYFFGVDTDDDYVRTMSLPIFVDEYGTLVAPTDYMIVEEEN